METMTIHHTRPRLLPSLAAIVALASILLAGCNLSNGGNAARDPNQVFVFPNTIFEHPLPQWGKDGGAAGNGPAESGLNLDPAFLSDLYSQTVDTMIQIQLVSFDENLHIIPDAAQLPDVSADGKTWTFHLRSNLFWADGTPLTSHDFVTGMQHQLDPNLCTTPGPFNPPDPATLKKNSCAGQQPAFSYLNAIKGAYEYANGKLDSTGKPLTTISGITAPDPETIQFQLIKPVPFFLGELATTASMPLETNIFKQSGYGYNYVTHFADPTPVSQSGPWMIKRWYDPNTPGVTDPTKATEIVFTPNPHWWGKPLQLKELDMPLIPSTQDWYNRYAQGSGTQAIDFADVPAPDYPYAQNLPDFHSEPELAIDYFGMNFFDPPFDNLQVRQAFDLALNKQSLVDTVFQGSFTPTNHIIPQGIPGYNPDLLTPPSGAGTVALTGNQQEARTLIQSVAQGCETNISNDWCPYIIGTGTNRVDISSVAASGAACPAFKVGVTSTNDTTQTPVVVYAAQESLNRVRLAKAAQQQWSSVLCLNVTTSNDAPNKPISGSQLFADTKHTAQNPGSTSLESIWTIGYGVDYVDPQDFTSNQFNLMTINNAENFGVVNPHSTLPDTQAQKAIEAAMSNADTMPVDTTAHQDARYAAYAAIEQQLVNEVAWLPYDQEQLLYRVRPYVQNFVLPPSGFISDQGWADIYISAHS
jgi:oligopeptide transport system substrate-binding protein